jgi:RNA polymerase sigma-70 factor (ECF subfamily)
MTMLFGRFSSRWKVICPSILIGQYEVTQTKRLVQEVLDCLPVNHGNALEWKYIEGFSVTEIASRLQVTELAAQSLLSRARSAFREALVELSPQMAIGR